MIRDPEESCYAKLVESGGVELLHQAFRSSEISPFESTSYLSDSEFEQIFIGREDEQRKIVDLVLSTVEDGGCRAIKLKGQGGVGKTTLFNAIRRTLNRERNEGGSKFNKLAQTHEIYATFFPMDSAYENLTFIWKKMFEGLSDQDANFFVDLAVKFIFKVLNLVKNDRSSAEELLEILYSGLHQKQPSVEFITEKDLKVLANQYVWLTEDIQKIIGFVDRHKRVILLHQETIAGKIFKIEPTQIERIKQYLLILDINSPMRSALTGETPELIKDDNSTLEWYNWITSFSSWVTSKITFFLIGIDEVSKIAASPDEYERKYNQFMTLLIQLRNKLRKVFFVFIDTNQGWRKIEDFIDAESDYRNQISAFIKDTIELEELSTEHAMTVFQRRIQLFWKRNNYEEFTLLPFNQPSLYYISAYKSNKLRETMNLLYKIWNYLKSKKDFTPIFDEFEAMRVVRSLNKDLPDDLSPSDLHPFEKRMLYRIFWENRNPASEAPNKYSLKIEPTLEEAFNVLANEKDRKVSRASRPTFDIPGPDGTHKRKPDVYIELFGSRGTEFIRNIEIQVKMYQEDQEVKLKELESSFDLIKNGRTDLVIFLITGKGLAKNAMDAVKTFEPNRFWKLEPLNFEEQVALIFLLYFNQITGISLSNPEHVKRCISEFIKWDTIVTFIQSIPKYAAIKGDEITTSEEPKDAEITEGKTPILPESVVDWKNLLPVNLQEKADHIMEIFKILHMSESTSRTFTDTFLRNRKPEHLTPDDVKNAYTLLTNTQYVEKVNKSFRLTREGLDLLDKMKASNWVS